jgi:hypothetical protein
MSTQTDPTPPATETDQAVRVITEQHLPDIKIYSHSPILYWWPVWALGFVLALVTAFDGGHMAYLPPGTQAVDGKLVAPAGGDALKPQEHMARNPYLGTVFFLTILVVFVCSNVQMRGLWEWVGVLVIALVITLISLYGLWETLLDWLKLLHIRINLAGYLFLATWVFAVWVVSVFVFDRRTYILFSAGQIRVRDEIGQAEKVFDVTNVTFQVQPNVFFRHRVLGLYGAGDLVVRTGGPHPEVLDWPNVLWARSKLRMIQEQLKAREVV